VSDGVETVARDYAVVVRETNQSPVWEADPARVAAEESLYEFRLAASDADIPAQVLNYRLLSGPTGLTVASDGWVRWVPTEVQGPSTNQVEVAVSDGFISVTNRVELRIREVNVNPIWVGETVWMASEGQTLSVKLPVVDADVPQQSLSFVLESGPDGLQLSADGFLAWTPTEIQGQSTNRVRVRISDGVANVPLEFDIVVRELNQPPVWVTPAVTRRVSEGVLLSFPVVATDADLPAQPLTYRVVSAPWGMTLSTNGVVSWRPTEIQGPSTNRVRIAVSDGVASVPLEFDVIVRDAITGSPGPTLGLSARVDGSWTLRVAGIGGARFQVEQRTQLSGAWSPVPGVPEVLTEGATVPTSIVLPANASPGLFIRLRKLE
jgi:hypothetical protein